MYNNLRAEMARNKVTVGALADFLGVRYATISDKLNRRSRFFLDESFAIKTHFFPNCSVEYLFDTEPTNQLTKASAAE